MSGLSESTESTSSRWLTLRWLDENPMAFAAAGFAIGAGTGALLPVSRGADAIVAALTGAYETIAPLIIFLVLAPSAIKLLRSDRPAGLRFTTKAMLWLCGLRLAASLLGVAFAAVLYRLPWTQAGSGAAGRSMAAAASGLTATAVHSPYIIALVFASAVALLLCRVPGRWVDRFGTIPDLIERAGGAMTRVTPLFTFFVGMYVSALPAILSGYLGRHRIAAGATVRMAGASIDASSPRGILVVYLAVSLATGVACALWHLLLLLRVWTVIPGFSLRRYASQYLARIYPLAWATCSESLATPVNLYLIRRLYPFTDAGVRQFAVAVGSAININGTVLCCFVLTPAVCAMIGQPLSVVSLLLCLPVIYLIGFGVPGIPGELLLFAGPIAAVLQIPAPLQPAFMALFLALQFGLPDSFRTSGNSTDLCPAALLLDRARRLS